MARTTIEISEELKHKLREEREPHESSYGDTIERLLGESDVAAWSEDEIRSMARAEAKDMIREYGGGSY